MKKNKISKNWINKQKRDIYVRQSKLEGYRSRAVYKLQEIQTKFKVINNGMSIVDLGATPGSWSEFISRKFKNIKLVAVDLKELDKIENVTHIKGDFTEEITQKKIENLGNFKNFSDLTLFIKNEYYQKSSLFKNKKINIKKALILQYERNYFELYNKKLRVTVDKKLKIFQKFPNKFIENDKLIIELKYSVKNSSYVNNFVKNNFLDNRNQKYSKYVNSFIDMNENALI